MALETALAVAFPLFLAKTFAVSFAIACQRLCGNGLIKLVGNGLCNFLGNGFVNVVLLMAWALSVGMALKMAWAMALAMFQGFMVSGL